MIGIIVMTHGSFSEEIIKSCELIAGPAERTAAIKLNRNDNIEDLNRNFVEKLNELDEGDGVLVLADLLGGSPSNVASLNLKKGGDFHALTGVNLPMLLEALINREGKNLEELADACIEAGKTGINNINKILSSM
ncbi:PTS sugar transporter subunit IIA [Clostridioides difficile]|nr:PTS sugar transporter subunit IIA [Clostridioides difficile]NJK14723.1 PTS sugar transporter subunit IIA [Clostridioides difficile]